MFLVFIYFFCAPKNKKKLKGDSLASTAACVGVVAVPLLLSDLAFDVGHVDHHLVVVLAVLVFRAQVVTVWPRTQA